MAARNLTEEDREAAWDEISDEVSALLQGQREIPASAAPFDATSTITIEQQRSDQLLTGCRSLFVAYADDTHMDSVFSGFFVSCLSCLLPQDVSKTDADGITKIEIFHHESWKPIYSTVKRSKVRVARLKK